MRSRLTYPAMVILAILLLAGEAMAQHNVYKGELRFGAPGMIRQNDLLIVDIDVDMSDVKMHRQQLIMLTPMLRLREEQENSSYICAPIAITGRVRYKALLRSMTFGRIYFEYEPEMIIKHRNGKKNVIPLSLSIPYEHWMSRAELVFIEEVTGCANCHVAYNEYVVTARPVSAPQPARLPGGDLSARAAEALIYDVAEVPLDRLDNFMTDPGSVHAHRSGQIVIAPEQTVVPYSGSLGGDQDGRVTIPTYVEVPQVRVDASGNPVHMGSQPYDEPNFMLSLVVPEVEAEKMRTETYTSSLNFVVGRADIIRNYKSNKERLDMIDRIIGNVKNDKNVTLTELKMVGYASPDGGFDNNLGLSKRRALAFVDYLKKTHSLPEYMVDFQWKGEDWATLREKVLESDMPERLEVAQVIDNHGNVTQRKAKIRSMNYGETYYYLLGVFYPSLRRDQYTISYIARNFDPAEARRIIYTKPHQLSLNEMFLVASTYPSGSPQFKEVFSIAARYFPGDRTAAVNAAAIEIESGEVDSAIRRLTGIDTPEAWNNLGIAYVKKGEYGLAEYYFRKAAGAGNVSAYNNFQQLQSWGYLR